MKIQDLLKKPMISASSLGQALTSACDLNCLHCYSRSYGNSEVGVKECELILRAFPNVKEINFGTGETYLNPKFLDIFRFYRNKGIKLALTTNGNTLKKMTDREIADFLSEVDLSMDFPRAELHDRWRGKQGIFKNALLQIERCKRLNIDVSIALALTNKNYRYLPGFARILEHYDIPLRINIYKPIHHKELQLSYEEFWQAARLIAENFGLIGSSEPILSLLTDSKTKGSPCGQSFRIHADLSISSCVYLSDERVETNEFIKLKKEIPSPCKSCSFWEQCMGGCLSRRILQVGAENPDFYCPLARGKKVPKIKFKKGQGKDLMHLKYLCTILLSKNEKR